MGFCFQTQTRDDTGISQIKWVKEGLTLSKILGTIVLINQLTVKWRTHINKMGPGKCKWFDHILSTWR